MSLKKVLKSNNLGKDSEIKQSEQLVHISSFSRMTSNHGISNMNKTNPKDFKTKYYLYSCKKLEIPNNQISTSCLGINNSEFPRIESTKILSNIKFGCRYNFKHRFNSSVISRKIHPYKIRKQNQNGFIKKSSIQNNPLIERNYNSKTSQEGSSFVGYRTKPTPLTLRNNFYQKLLLQNNSEFTSIKRSLRANTIIGLNPKIPIQIQPLINLSGYNKNYQKIYEKLLLLSLK